MSADTLRRAAALMRERAEAAAPGPWYQPPGDNCTVWYGASFDEVKRVDEGLTAGTVTEVEAEVVYEQTGFLAHGDFDQPEDAAYVSGMHPAVALAVADWLDSMASRAESKIALGGNESAVWSYEIHALAVARTYLGGAA